MFGLASPSVTAVSPAARTCACWSERAETSRGKSQSSRAEGACGASAAKTASGSPSRAGRAAPFALDSRVATGCQNSGSRPEGRSR